MRTFIIIVFTHDPSGYARAACAWQGHIESNAHRMLPDVAVVECKRAYLYLVKSPPGGIYGPPTFTPLAWASDTGEVTVVAQSDGNSQS